MYKTRSHLIQQLKKLYLEKKFIKKLPSGHSIVRYKKNVHRTMVKTYLKRYAKQLRLKELFGHNYINKALKFMEQKNVRTLVYCIDNKHHIGFLTYSITPRKALWNKVNANFLLGNKATIHFFCISISHRNNGYGTSLLKRALTWLHAQTSVVYVTAQARHCDIVAHYVFEKAHFNAYKDKQTVLYTHYFDRNNYSFDKRTQQEYKDLLEGDFFDNTQDSYLTKRLHHQQIHCATNSPTQSQQYNHQVLNSTTDVETCSTFETLPETNTSTTMTLGQVNVSFDNTKKPQENVEVDGYTPLINSWKNWWFDDGYSGQYKFSDYYYC